MPMFYFDVVVNGHRQDEEEPLEFENAEAARAEAALAALHIAADSLDGSGRMQISIEVADSERLHLYTVQLALACDGQEKQA